MGFNDSPSSVSSYSTRGRHLSVNHVALNLRFNTANIEATLEKPSNDHLPDFQS